MRVFLYLFLFLVISCGDVKTNKSLIMEDSVHNSVYSSVINIENLNNNFENSENTDIGEIEYNILYNMSMKDSQTITIKIKQDTDIEDEIDISQFKLETTQFIIKELPTTEQILDDGIYTICKYNIIPMMVGTHKISLNYIGDEKIINIFNKNIQVNDIPLYKYYYTINSIDKIDKNNLSQIELKMSIDSISNEYVILDKDSDFILKTADQNKVTIDNGKFRIQHNNIKTHEQKFYFLPSEDTEDFILKLYKDDKLFWQRKYKVQKNIDDYLLIGQNYQVYISTIIIPLFMQFQRRIKRILILKKICILLESDFDRQDLEVYVVEAKEICSARMRLELDDILNHDGDYFEYINYLKNNIYKELYKF